MKRFWEKVNRKGDDDCWLWLAGTVSFGKVKYGAFGWTSPRRMIYAHRVAYFLSIGVNPAHSDPRQVVRHLCHNGLCCNPAHLALGTPLDNWYDMVDAGRLNPAKGEDVGGAKLTEKHVKEIRRLLACRESQASIAKRFDVGRGAITAINLGHTWRHVK